MQHNSDVAAPLCAERLRLSDIVAIAVQANYAAKAAHDLAINSKKDGKPSAVIQAQARFAEKTAVSALNKHRTEHGC